ncbi:hypothetical protein Rmet_6714 (plasmid) [Cupriavidus metallidurans CH34]|uniref:Uncharacterized protein n=1 Tax=Cupriavidus metallidurans (strain ATCC 43123 / DSM 2839 / NBRC 102507 / CH34) TaxID=266264 RepID=D3DYC4_CUPMC|nr:hypothetical protein Rmet_6714 [Cupriavidus metallidurans CH34]
MQVAIPGAQGTTHLKRRHYFIRLHFDKAHAKKARQIISTGRVPFFQRNGGINVH